MSTTMRVESVQLDSIRRPLQSSLDQQKLEELVQSIRDEGLREPIDLLEVDGQLWGFNGCHRVPPIAVSGSSLSGPGFDGQHPGI